MLKKKIKFEKRDYINIPQDPKQEKEKARKQKLNKL